MFSMAKDAPAPGEEIELEELPKRKSSERRFEFPSDDESGHAPAPLSARSRRMAEQFSSFKDEFEKKALFKDFTEPDLLKTGYLIPLRTGHNG